MIQTRYRSKSVSLRRLLVALCSFILQWTSLQATIVSTPFGKSYQVNVNSGGQNIAGDAANEPSMCIDPTNPNRMAIGWRQFDSTNSSFRQSGVAYTTNGGRNWIFPGNLEAGTFRSDPAIRARLRATSFARPTGGRTGNASGLPWGATRSGWQLTRQLVRAAATFIKSGVHFTTFTTMRTFSSLARLMAAPVG